MKQIAQRIILGPNKLRLIQLAAVLIVIGGAVWFIVSQNNNDTPDTEPLISYSTDTPDESLETARNYDWRGLPNEPKRIFIEKLGVDAYIQKAGVDQHGKIAVPTSVHLTGWFAQSATPGQNGLSIIAGHVTGNTGGGVFKELSKLDDGDEFDVELGSGEIKRYRVMSTLSVKEPKAASLLFSQNPKVKSQLNLIICDGNFDPGSRLYDKRVIVTSEYLSD